MKTQSNNITVVVIVAVAVLGRWGVSENNKRTMLEWDLEVYRSRLMKYEDSSVVEHILDSLKQDYAEEMEYERKAMGR